MNNHPRPIDIINKPNPWAPSPQSSQDREVNPWEKYEDRSNGHTVSQVYKPETGNSTPRGSELEKEDDPVDSNHSSSDDPSRTSSKRSASPATVDNTVPKAKKMRFVSPERENLGTEVLVHKPLPAHTHWRYTEPEEIDPRQFNEVPVGEAGHTVTVDSWLDAETGVLCSSAGFLVFFHINQLWELISASSWTQMQEIYSSAEIRAKFPLGTKLRCSYRKKDLTTYSYQATAVWKDGVGPKCYRTREYLEDLTRTANNFRSSNKTTGSLFSRSRAGVVKEYMSHETGLIRNCSDNQQ